MSATATPTFSVVIATYNWSAALRLALQSVLEQTFADFEVLVVGDACSDDSADVVASFGDARLHWHNLETNCGSQWGPNNHALAVARGEYIAYLGHDDLWWPTHLASAKAEFERSGADVVAAATLLYGPPDSGFRAVSGFFPNDTWSERHFFPPSSMSHRLDLARRVGGWPSPEQATVAVDVSFLRRCAAAGARIVSTGEFTAFKFNAAWRRDAYRRRDVDEQRHFLASMRQHGDAFRLAELTAALRAASESRLRNIEVPMGARMSATTVAAPLQQFKGSRRTRSQLVPAITGNTRRYAVPTGYAGYEWHDAEQHARLGLFRWTGPCRTSSIALPEHITGPTRIGVRIVLGISAAVIASARLGVNGVMLDSEVVPAPDGTHLLRASVLPQQVSQSDDEDLLLTISVAQTWRPVDLGLSDHDMRWLGVAVAWIELESLDTAGTGP